MREEEWQGVGEREGFHSEGVLLPHPGSLGGRLPCSVTHGLVQGDDASTQSQPIPS